MKIPYNKYSIHRMSLFQNVAQVGKNKYVRYAEQLDYFVRSFYKIDKPDDFRSPALRNLNDSLQPKKRDVKKIKAILFEYVDGVKKKYNINQPEILDASGNPKRKGVFTCPILKKIDASFTRDIKKGKPLGFDIAV